MKKTALVLALMLRVFWSEKAGSFDGIVIGASIPPANRAWLVVRKDDGKVTEINVEWIRDSRWEDVKP